MDKAVHIVGIGGLPRSGKDTLAELFIDAGYFGVSLGDIVRDISRQRHVDTTDPISVAHMTETSNWLRSQKGPDFALKEALVRYDLAQQTDSGYIGLVVYSVRAPIEVDFILKSGGELIWIETEDGVRYARAMQHRRDGEAAISLEEFKAQEDLQRQPQPGLPADVQMNTQYVKDKATITFQNEHADIKAFRQEAQSLIQRIASKQ